MSSDPAGDASPGRATTHPLPAPPPDLLRRPLRIDLVTMIVLGLGGLAIAILIFLIAGPTVR